jgi:hypothetical protein
MQVRQGSTRRRAVGQFRQHARGWRNTGVPELRVRPLPRVPDTAAGILADVHSSTSCSLVRIRRLPLFLLPGFLLPTVLLFCFSRSRILDPSQVLYYLKIDLDWGLLSVYTCAGSCNVKDQDDSSANSTYLDEFVWQQSVSEKAAFKIPAST